MNDEKRKAMEAIALQMMDAKQGPVQAAQLSGLSQYECAKLWARERPGQTMLLSLQDYGSGNPPVEIPIAVQAGN
jgi:hypothetical protein